jgi:hypothetical protein
MLNDDSDNAQNRDAAAATATSPMSAALGNKRKKLPQGYRQGVITAITVIIGFSLAFVRFWAFEAPGEWTPISVTAAVIMVIPIVAQIWALYRALLVEDDDEDTYRKTIKLFVGSIVGMLFALCFSAFVIAGVFEGTILGTPLSQLFQ